MNRKYLFAAIMSAVFLCAFAAARFRVLRQNPRYAQKRACREVETMQQEKVLRDGDLIFQTSLSGQSRAIQEATGSKYSHCGIIYRDGCDYFVYEAVQSVKSTPLAQWIARGKGGHYVVKRLAGADSLLTERNIAAMRREAARFAGRDYDLTFGWSDDRLYCSELIWKIYDRTPTGQPAATGRFRPLRTGRPGETRRTLWRRAAPRRTGHLPRCHLRFPPPRPRHRPVTCRE